MAHSRPDRARTPCVSRTGACAGTRCPAIAPVLVSGTRSSAAPAFERRRCAVSRSATCWPLAASPATARRVAALACHAPARAGDVVVRASTIEAVPDVERDRAGDAERAPRRRQGEPRAHRRSDAPPGERVRLRDRASGDGRRRHRHRAGRRPTFGGAGMKMQLSAGLLAAPLVALAPADRHRRRTPPVAPRSLFADRRAQHAGRPDHRAHHRGGIGVSQRADTHLNKGESANAICCSVTAKCSSPTWASTGKFAGGGQIERSGTLLARLTVQIDGVDANGNFIVSGEQLIVINNEKQTIRRLGNRAARRHRRRQHRAVVARGGHRHPAARQRNALAEVLARDS